MQQEWDIPFFEYANIFAGNMIFFRAGLHEKISTFDLTIRELPEKWSFFIFNGLDRFIDLLKKFRFDDDGIGLLKKLSLIDSQETESFYRNFRFRGDIWSLKDGAVFFPGEPILRVSASLLEANVLTAFILNSFNYPILNLTKGVRIKLACVGKPVVLVGIRLNSFEQGMTVARTSFFLDAFHTAQLLFPRKFPELVTPQGFTPNINHAIIKSFPTEEMAFRCALDTILPRANIFSIMVDTYHFEKGLDRLIREIDKTPSLSQSDKQKIVVTIDSGDLEARSWYTRKKLDTAGYRDIKIQVMGNLEEYKISAMVKDKAPIDIFVSVTEFVNVTDAPKLEAVYKLAELRHSDGTVEQKAKLTPGKESYPGRKQIFRIYENGKMTKDIIGLENESLGEPLLHKVIENGEVKEPLPSLEEVKIDLQKSLETLPDSLITIDRQAHYPVEISRNLRVLLDTVKKQHGHDDGEH